MAAASSGRRAHSWGSAVRPHRQATAVPHDPAPTTATRIGRPSSPAVAPCRRRSLTRVPRTASLSFGRPGEERRTYVLDTCVLLADPGALFRFEEHDVVLPLVVIEELDRKKTLMDEVGANARRTIRLLEGQGASRPGGMSRAGAVPSGGPLRIELNGIHSDRLPEVLDPRTPDHRILSTCLELGAALTGEKVLVTRDASLRIKAAQLGGPGHGYRAHNVAVHGCGPG